MACRIWVTSLMKANYSSPRLVERDAYCPLHRQRDGRGPRRRRADRRRGRAARYPPSPPYSVPCLSEAAFSFEARYLFSVHQTHQQLNIFGTAGDQRRALVQALRHDVEDTAPAVSCLALGLFGEKRDGIGLVHQPQLSAG